jgi:MFS family permease
VTTTTAHQQIHRELGTAGVVVLLAGPFLAGLDFFIVNVALPTIHRSLGASPAALELVVAGYGTAYAVFLVLGGRLGDEYGRRRLFAIGLAAFTITSLAAGVAPTTAVLLVARVLQGAASALMVPQTLATYQSAMTGPARGRAVAVYTAAGGLASVVGQLLGGVLVSTVSWRAVFLVNVPIGVAALLLLRRTVPASRSDQRVGVDVRGTVLLGVALAALLVPLAEGPALGWPWWTWTSLGVFALAAVASVTWSRAASRRGITPLLPLGLVAGAVSMRRGLPAMVGFFAVFGVFMFAFAVVAQDGLGLSPLAAGIAIAPVCVAYVVTSWRVPSLVARFGRRALVAGLLTEAAGLAALVGIIAAWWEPLRDGSIPEVVVSVLALVLVGAGQAVGVGALFRLVLSEVPVSAAGVGGGVLVTTQQASLALGVAGLGTVFTAASAGSIATGAVVIGIVTAAGCALLAAIATRMPSA